MKVNAKSPRPKIHGTGRVLNPWTIDAVCPCPDDNALGCVVLLDPGQDWPERIRAQRNVTIRGVLHEAARVWHGAWVQAPASLLQYTGETYHVLQEALEIEDHEPVTLIEFRRKPPKQ